jgi:hypothetical protein
MDDISSNWSEERYNEIKKNTDVTTQTKLEQLQTLLNEKTAFIENLAADARKAGVDSKTMSQEMVRNRAALQDAEQADIQFGNSVHEQADPLLVFQAEAAQESCDRVAVDPDILIAEWPVLG